MPSGCSCPMGSQGPCSLSAKSGAMATLHNSFFSPSRLVAMLSIAPGLCLDNWQLEWHHCQAGEAGCSQKRHAVAGLVLPIHHSQPCFSAPHQAPLAGLRQQCGALGVSSVCSVPVISWAPAAAPCLGDPIAYTPQSAQGQESS